MQCIFFQLCNLLNTLFAFLQTLGIGHAFSSFIWLCGPITGLVVGDSVTFLSLILIVITSAEIHFLLLLNIPTALVHSNASLKNIQAFVFFF